MIIDNTRLPTDVERGVRGGPMFSTTVTMTDGGNTDTNQNWTYPLYKGNIGYGIQSKTLMDTVVAFFWARRGRQYGFLFKDWSDYTFTGSNLGTGDGVNQDFQCVKVYADSVRPFTRILKYPIESTMTVYKDGVAVPEADWSLLSTGEIRFTLGATPLAGVVITASGEFNIACRFLSDDLEIEMAVFNAGSVPSIPIMEIRE